MIGLTWDAIDWQNRTLTVDKTLEYRHKQGSWRAGAPKAQKSYRTIPLTDRAYDILQEIYQTRPVGNNQMSYHKHWNPWIDIQEKRTLLL